jgi:hypothetical protein
LCSSVIVVSFQVNSPAQKRAVELENGALVFNAAVTRAPRNIAKGLLGYPVRDFELAVFCACGAAAVTHRKKCHLLAMLF